MSRSSEFAGHSCNAMPICFSENALQLIDCIIKAKKGLVNPTTVR